MPAAWATALKQVKTQARKPAEAFRRYLAEECRSDSNVSGKEVVDALKRMAMLGTADVLGHLRADLKRARSIAWIVGPWIDGFFAQIVLDVAPNGVNCGWSPGRPRVPARASRTTHLPLGACLAVVEQSLSGCWTTSTRSLSSSMKDRLLRKCELVQLQESRELVLRGPAEDAVGLQDELHTIWEAASEDAPVPLPVAGQEVAKGYPS